MGKRCRGEGTLSQRKSDGRWIGQIFVPDGKGGKTRKCVSDKTQQGCKKKIDEIKKQLQLNTYVPPDTITYAEYLKIWLEQKEKLEKLKPSTIETHQQRIDTHIVPELGHYQMQKITIGMINNLYTKLTKVISAHTIRKVHAIINNSFKFAKRDGIVLINPASDALLPKFMTKQKKSLTSEEIFKLLKAAKEYQEKKTTRTINAYPLTLFAINTGLRRGELAGLMWSNVDLNNNCITVNQALVELNSGKCILDTPKTESSLRTIYISEHMVEVLKKHKEKATGIYVFPAMGKPDTPMAPNNISRFYRNIVKRAVLDGGIHLLRHSHITQLLESGVNIKTIQDRAGHANISTTIGYCSPSKEKDKDAASKFNQYK